MMKQSIAILFLLQGGLSVASAIAPAVREILVEKSKELANIAQQIGEYKMQQAHKKDMVDIYALAVVGVAAVGSALLLYHDSKDWRVWVGGGVLIGGLVGGSMGIKSYYTQQETVNLQELQKLYQQKSLECSDFINNNGISKEVVWSIFNQLIPHQRSLMVSLYLELMLNAYLTITCAEPQIIY